MNASGAYTATILVIDGRPGEHWGEGQAEVVDVGPHRTTLAFTSVSAAVASALAAREAGAAAGLAVGEVTRLDSGWAGSAIASATTLATRARDLPGRPVLATAAVRWLGALPGDRFVAAGPLDGGLLGVIECVEVLPAQGDRPVPLPSVLTMVEPFAFVPRLQPWAALETAWAQARSGPRQVVLVAGEAGAGKTRLTAEFARSVHGRGDTVLYGVCSDKPSMPYEPFAAALAHLSATLDVASLAALVGDRGAELARLVPGMAREADPPSPSVPGDADTERWRLYNAVAVTLATLAAQRPVLLVLDDLQWAGRSTIELLDHLTRSSLDRLCLVVVYRSTPAEIGDALKSALPDLRRRPGLTRTAVTGFDRDDIRRFVEAAAGHDVDAALEPAVDLLVAQTGGNPFLVGELWRHLADTGHIVNQAGHWRVELPLGDMASPEGVREVVAARLGRLPPETGAVLAVASVLGTEFHVRALAPAVGRAVREVVASLEPALEARLIEETDPGDYRFSHVLVRRSVYDSLASSDRRNHHLEVARVLEQIAGDSAVAEIANHMAAAVPVADPALAVEVGRRAAARAQRAVAYDDAARHLAAVLPFAPFDRTRCEVLLELADANMRAGDVTAAQGRCMEVNALARQLGERGLVVAAALTLDDANWRAALHGGVAEELLRDALAFSDDQVVQIRLRAALGRSLAFSGKGEEAWTVTEEALVAARAVGNYSALRIALNAVLVAPWVPATVTRQLAAARELLERARAAADAEGFAGALNRLLYGLILVGELDEARVVAAEHQASANASGQPLFRVLDLQAHALLATGEGRFAEAEVMATEADQLGRSLSGTDASGGYGVQLFSLRREQGRLDEARPMVEAVARLGQEAATWRPALALLYAELGLFDEARAELGHLVADDMSAVPRDSLWCGSLSYLADACLAVADRDAAALLYRELLPYRGLVVQVGSSLAAFGAADRCLASLAALLGRTRDAEKSFDAALRLELRAGMPVWLARTQLSYGTFLIDNRKASDRPRAEELLIAARQTADRLAMTTVSQMAAAQLDRIGTSPDRTASTGAAGLTHREAAVLRLLIEGRSNREIGERLHISHHTAANHVRAILLKTGCVNRTEAAAWAALGGLDDGGPEAPASQ